MAYAGAHFEKPQTLPWQCKTKPHCTSPLGSNPFLVAPPEDAADFRKSPAAQLVIRSILKCTTGLSLTQSQPPGMQDERTAMPRPSEVNPVACWGSTPLQAGSGDGAGPRRVSLRNELSAGSVLGCPFARERGKRGVKWLRSQELDYPGRAKKKSPF